MNKEQQEILDKAKKGAGLVCHTCKRPIDLNSDEIFSANDGRFWCDEKCLSRPKL